MRSLAGAILIAGIAAVPLVAADKGGTGSPLGRPPVGSIAAQLELKFRLMREASGSLTASLDHNWQAWRSLSPDQREQFRREALAFLRKSPDEQEKLIARYRKFIQMSAGRREAFVRRAQWLEKVVASFTAEQREKLQQLPPKERARILLERRKELIRKGVLAADEPTSRKSPTTLPAP